MLANATELRNTYYVSLQNRLEQFKENNHRITKTREAVLAHFEKNHKPITAREIINHLHALGLTVNKTTVYRELTFLLSQDFIKEVRLSDQELHYETTSMDHHHHLICTNCKSIEGVEYNSVETELVKLEKDFAKRHDFLLQDHMLEFFGLCAQCQKGASV